MMKEFIIATDDMGSLMIKLASSVIGEHEIELTISDSTSTRSIWFTPTDVSSKGFIGKEVFSGLVATKPLSAPTDKTIGRIQTEENMLILITDL